MWFEMLFRRWQHTKIWFLLDHCTSAIKSPIPLVFHRVVHPISLYFFSSGTNVVHSALLPLHISPTSQSVEL